MVRVVGKIIAVRRRGLGIKVITLMVCKTELLVAVRAAPGHRGHVPQPMEQ